MKKTVRINFEFPREAYPYLKMLCAAKGISLKDFATQLLLQAIEEHEEGPIIKKGSGKKAISWDEARALAGLDDALNL